MPENPPTRRHLVQSFGRGLAVIRAFADGEPDLTLSEIAERAGVTRAAARRFLLTMVELGYVHSDGKYFALRPSVLELGNAYLSSMKFGDVALPHMDELVGRVEDSSALCVLSGDDIVYVALARVPSRGVMALNIAIGARLPAYLTSMGRVLLAGRPAEWREDYLARTELRPFTPHTVADPAKLRVILEAAERDGYALVDRELDVGLRSIAVPLRRPAGEVYAALNVSMHPSRRTVEAACSELLEPLRRAVRAIETDMLAIARRRSAHIGGGADVFFEG